MRKVLTISVCICILLQSHAQKIPTTEAVEINQILKLGKSLKEGYWPDWASTPFSILLVTPQNEFLIGHPNASNFSSTYYSDSIFKEDIYYRPASFPLNMAATFPLIDRFPVIVMGDIDHANFGKSRWSWTLLHEHFHQFQMLSDGYFQKTNELDLARDSTDFMWQLNYPFPYEDMKIGRIIDEMCSILVKSWEDEEVSISKYFKLRNELKKSISEKDYRYFNFQVWQEGLPRYLEVALVKEAISSGYTPLNELLEEYNKEINQALKDPDFSNRKRILYYSLGAAEWNLIDKSLKDWKSSYLERPFEVDYLFELASE